MKLKLLLVFTICSMVSIAQTKSTSNNSLDTPSFSVATDNYSTTNQNETINSNGVVKIYPSYTHGFVYFKTSDLCEKFKIKVYDIYGSHHEVEIHDEGAIDLTPLKEGIYIIKFTCGKFSVTKNIVKK